MTKPTCSDEEFIKLFETLGGEGTAKELGVATRNVFKRRRKIEKNYNRILTPPGAVRLEQNYPQRLEFDILNGIIPIGSDAHVWPGQMTTAQRAFLKFLEEYKFQIPMVVLNGDVFDGARVGRWPTVNYQELPTVKEELEAVKAFTNKVEAAVPDAIKVWPIGNHDQRYEARLSQQAPEYGGIHGFSLNDFFGEWQSCMSCYINQNSEHPILIKHRFKGGMHATQNNVLWTGIGHSVVTGHLHSLKVTPVTGYPQRTSYGVDTGTLSHIHGQQFLYSEDNPRNHRSGFAVLTIANGELLWPEVVHVMDEDAGKVQFRGQTYEV